MALLPMGTETDQFTETQESMFEDATGYPGHDFTDVPNEAEALQFDVSEEPSPEEQKADQPAVEQSALEQASLEQASPEQSNSEQASPAQPEGNSNSTPESSSGPEAESPALPLTVLSVDDFGALEERVLKAVSLVRRERHARIAAEENVAALESQLLHAQSQTPIIERLQDEVDSLRAEREQVRQRVERLLSQLDALEL